MSDDGEKSSWLEPLPEEYTRDGDMTGRRMLIAALTVIVLAIFGGVIWYSYLDGSRDGPVPAVRADKSVVKIKPDSPGGLEVPDQDKRVFDRITTNQTENESSLAPSAELPVDLPVTEEDNVDIPESEDIGEETGAVEDVEAEAEVANITPSSPAPSATVSPAGRYLVQFGAFSKKASAEQLWMHLQKENTTLLADLDADIMMVDLGKKGVLYRLRGGMIADRTAANDICASLKAKDQPCIVVTK